MLARFQPRLELQVTARPGDGLRKIASGFVANLVAYVTSQIDGTDV